MRPAPNPAGPGPARTVVGDLPCGRCGYNLRSLKTDTVCPECGTPVGRSLRHFLCAPPGYVARLASGARLVLWALVLGVGLTVLAFPLAAMARRGDAPHAMAFTGLLITVGPILSAVGWWRLTVREPGVVEPRWGAWVLRTAATVFAVAVADAAVVPVLMAIVGEGPGVPPVAFLPVAWMAWSIRTALGSAVLQRIGRRLGSRFGSGLASVVFVLSAVNLIPAMMAWALVLPGDPDTGAATREVVSFVGFPLVLLLLAAYFVLLVHLYRRLRGVAQTLAEHGPAVV